MHEESEKPCPNFSLPSQTTKYELLKMKLSWEKSNKELSADSQEK
jgi:hypothetical protein